MKKKREETFPKEQKMRNATNNLKPHLLAKVGAKSLQMVTVAMKLKDTYSLEGKL